MGLLDVYRRAYAGLPRAAWLVALAAFVNRAGTMVLTFLPVWLVDEHGLDEASAASFVSLWGGGAVVGVQLGGRLADSLGPLPVVVASFAGVAAVFLGLPACDGAGAIGALVFAGGLVGEAFRPAVAALLTARCTAAELPRSFALHRMALNAGMAVGPAAGGLLSEVSWTAVFAADALTCLAAAAILLAAFGGGRASGDAAPAGPRPRPRSPLRDLPFVGFVAALTLVGLVFVQFIALLAVYLTEELGWSRGAAGGVLGLNPLLVALLEMVLLARLAPRRPLRVIALGAALAGAGMGALALSPAAAWVVACVTLFTLGEILEATLGASFAALRGPRGARGRYMALHGVAFSVAFVVGPAAGGAVQRALGWGSLWGACAILGTLSAAGFLLVARAVEREAPRSP